MRSTSGSTESRRSSASVTQPATARAAAAIMPLVTCVAPAAMQPSPMPAAELQGVSPDWGSVSYSTTLEGEAHDAGCTITTAATVRETAQCHRLFIEQRHW